eukprot:TRINITY_DN54625_c0_g1_i1.p1 TRINITY_DN54625_c0_g1~~TRINITY_DN54625_c0_g1_i1.p1  ORF type:complete len:305 (+),score=40.32 TRINITY_DN54625_c0_g1_i1:220-1134(+)
MTLVKSMPAAMTSPAPPLTCELLSTSFGWHLQVIIGSLCFLSLVGKRFTDRVPRLWKVWLFDTSKQGVSAMVVHFLNMAIGGLLDVHADACNWYWITLILDDTLGVAMQFLLLRWLQCFYRSKFAKKPAPAQSGEYGDPPDYRTYVRQMLEWQCIIILQKCVFIVSAVRFNVRITTAASALLGWLDALPYAKLTAVMVLTPLTMNVFALWVVDSFLKSESISPRDAEAREMLVRGKLAFAMGQRGDWRGGTGGGGCNATEMSGPSPAYLLDNVAEDDSDRIMSFQDWKERAGDSARSRIAGTSP